MFKYRVFQKHYTMFDFVERKTYKSYFIEIKSIVFSKV